MAIKNYIPNAFTMANLFCGCLATLFAINDHLDWAAAFVAIGVFFDFFDGFFARILTCTKRTGITTRFPGRYDYQWSGARRCHVQIAG